MAGTKADAMPVLPLASVMAALLPATAAWNRSG